MSLARWERLFGERFGGLFVFAYNVVGDRAPLPAEELFEFRGGSVRLRGHSRCASTRCMPGRFRSRWDTLAMPTAHFRQLAAPVTRFFVDEGQPQRLAAAV